MGRYLDSATPRSKKDGGVWAWQIANGKWQCQRVVMSFNFVRMTHRVYSKPLSAATQRR